MPLTILHAKSLTLADGTTTSVVRPSDWNSGHVITLGLDSTEIIRNFIAGGVTVSTGAISFVNTNGFLWTMGTDGHVSLSMQLTLSIPAVFLGLASGNTIVTAGRSSTGANVSRSQSMCPLYVTNAVVGSVGFLVPITANISTSAAARTNAFTVSAGLFSLNGTSVVSFASGTFVVSASVSSRSVSMSFGGFSTSFSTTAATTWNVGYNYVLSPGSSTLNPGTYWFGMALDMALSGGSAQIAVVTNPAFNQIKVGSGAASSANDAEKCLTFTTAAWATSVALAGLTQANVSAAVGYFN